MHVDGGVRIGARLEERIPEAAVDGRQPEVRGDFAEAHGVHTTGRVATHLSGGEVGVPQRDDAQWDQAAARVAAPLLDHPVVVGVDALEPDLTVLRLGEGLAAEAGERGEGERLLDMVDVHVEQAELGVPAPLTHLVVADGRERHVVAGKAHRGHVALVGVHVALVEPDVAHVAGPVFGVDLVLVVEAALVQEAADAMTLDLGAFVAVLLGEPGLPEVGRLDHMIIDADDQRDDRRFGVDGIGSGDRHCCSPSRTVSIS